MNINAVAGCVGRGRGIEGQLGNGVFSGSNSPVAVIGLPIDVNVAYLSLGPLHACAILTDGGVACWGDNPNGQVCNARMRLLSVVSVQLRECMVGLVGWRRLECDEVIACEC